MKCYGLAVGVFAALALPVVAGAQDKVIPFTTWQAEQQAIVRGLPCKWVSMNGKYAGGRYDFLCKGGTWATVSLFMDKSDGIADGVGGIRLQYVDWNPKVHPNAGEAFVAQKFLTHVVNRFVPGSSAAAVLEAFWREGGRTWSGSGVTVTYSFEDGGDYGIHKLDVKGTGRTLVGVQGVVTQEVTGVTPSDAGLLRGEDGVQWKVMPTPPAGPVRWTSDTTSVAPVPLPVPQEFSSDRPVREIIVPSGLPVAVQDSSTLEKTKAAIRELLGDKAPPALQPASPADLNTGPAPESLARPTPPPAVSTTLVPDPREIENGPRAPSSFDAYNKAQELTRDIEKRANTQTILPSKVKPVDAARGTLAPKPAETSLTAPLPQPAPYVPATPTPGVDVGPNTDATVPGTGKPVRFSPEELESGGLGAYDPMNPARSKEVRPLPQLQFIPKAIPQKGDEVIQFEDERSRL